MSQTREPPVLQHRQINHLPYDIIPSILRRLPVKSVIKFKCVSKSLDSSITSSDFIYTHLNQNNNNNNKDDDDHRYLIHMPVPLPCTNRDISTELNSPKSKYEFLLADTETLQEKKDPDIQYPSLVATFMESLVILDGANIVSY
ncbi:hypothetical protein SO802_009535 [Lithocarpus litseifolius]|uniref:F-box domain-containing protein n=1 Tax=Lithocarpus litseifolius TaxID=425828 RepID=A0AAW2DEK0_9ROSI